MAKKKTLRELTLKDNFMFGAVMSDEENCRRLLELILQIPIERVTVSKEKTIIYNPECKGVRLDVYAKDEKNTHYNVEMQTVLKRALEKRTRYYHSQIDMELLFSGADYSELPDTYVIFICDFDLFGEGKYCYTFEQRCKEDNGLYLQDGSRSIFLSTQGKNRDEVPQELVKFLEFVKADLKDSMKDYEDEFVGNLQMSIQKIKETRKWEEHFMGWYDIMEDEKAEARAEGKAEGKAELLVEILEEVGTIPENIREKIMEETDLSVLGKWCKLAIKSESIEQFIQKM